MNPAVESNDALSDPEAEVPGLDETIIAMLDLLDKLDDLLAKPAWEVWRDSNKPNSFPISEDEFNVIIAAKNRYRDAGYEAEEVRAYLSRLPDFDDIWGDVCRGILRSLRHDPSRLREWHLWLKQVERVGTQAWQKAVNASHPIATSYPQGCGGMLNALVHKLAVVDELIDEMYGEFQWDKREVGFSIELGDSM